MRREWLVGLLLAAAVVLVYWPVHRFPFVNLDDTAYVSENAVVRKGLTADSLHFAFTCVTVSNWHPLTILSHMLDCQLYGAKDAGAGGHHLTNLALHVANTLLLFWVLRLMTGAVWRSALVGALFGLHPLHVESVAWISERKDVLSTFFFMLLLLAYYYYSQRRTVLRYILVFVLLTCGLMSKPMLVTAPLVLLLLDYWPLGRMMFAVAAPAVATDGEDEEFKDEADGDAGADHDEADDAESPTVPFPTAVDEPPEDGAANEASADSPELAGRHSLGWLIAEKLPLFIPVALSAMLAMIIQGQSGAMGMLGENLGFLTRVANAICSYGLYLEKMFWPWPLAAIYPYNAPKLIDVLIIAVALGAITVAAYHLSRLKPYLAVGWYWYLITLVPVIGLVQVGVQSMADRYTYIPLIGIFIIAAWGVAELVDDLSGQGKAGVAVACVAVLMVFACLTSRQVATWADSETLFRHAATVEPNNFVALDGLGKLYWHQGHLDKAHKEFAEILKIESDPALHVEGGLEPAHRAMGMLLAAEHKPGEAFAELDKAIVMRPKLPDARRDKAWLLATYPDDKYRNGKEAVQLAKEALELSRRKSAEYWDTLAVAQAETGKFEDAVESEEKAIEAAKRVRAEDLLPSFEERLDRFRSRYRYHVEPTQPERI